MNITLPRILSNPTDALERLKAERGILRIEKRSLLEQLEARRIDYAAAISERDALRTAMTTAQAQINALCERNDELNAELAESRAECAARCALLRRAIGVSVMGMELRREIEAATAQKE